MSGFLRMFEAPTAAPLGSALTVTEHKKSAENGDRQVTVIATLNDGAGCGFSLQVTGEDKLEALEAAMAACESLRDEVNSLRSRLRRDHEAAASQVPF